MSELSDLLFPKATQLNTGNECVNLLCDVRQYIFGYPAAFNERGQIEKTAIISYLIDENDDDGQYSASKLAFIQDKSSDDINLLSVEGRASASILHSMINRGLIKSDDTFDYQFYGSNEQYKKELELRGLNIE